MGITYFSENIVNKGAVSDSTIKIGYKIYVGGPKAATFHDSGNIYVREYKTTAFQEYIRMKCLYRGLDSISIGNN